MCGCRYLGLEPRLTSGTIQGGGAETQIAGAGVIGPASAEKTCKSAHLTVKQQAICSRSPPVLQVSISRQAEGPYYLSLSRSFYFFLFFSRIVCLSFACSRFLLFLSLCVCRSFACSRSSLSVRFPSFFLSLSSSFYRINGRGSTRLIRFAGPTTACRTNLSAFFL